MALITRFARLFRADMHAILDRIEEPDTLLRQSVREMDELIQQEQQRVTFMDHELQQLISRQSEVEHSLNQIEEQLDICFAARDEELARAQVKRKLQVQQQHKLVIRQRSTLERGLAQAKSRLEENRARCQAMRQKVQLLDEQTAVQTTGRENWHDDIEFTVGQDEIEVAFLREQQKRRSS